MQGMVKMTVFAVGWLLLFMVHPAALQRDNEGEGRGRGRGEGVQMIHWWLQALLS